VFWCDVQCADGVCIQLTILAPNL